MLDFLRSDFSQRCELIGSLPPTLRKQLDLMDKHQLFLNVPFLSGISSERILKLLPCIVCEYAWPHNYILAEGNIARRDITIRLGLKGACSGCRAC